MKNLENYGVQELDVSQSIQINGGGKGRLLKKIGKWLWNALSIADAVDSFQEGFSEGNSGNCAEN